MKKTMKKAMKSMEIRKDGIYCRDIKNLKNRLILTGEIETMQRKGYATIPIEVEGMGVGFFKFTLEEEKFLMGEMKEKRQKNNSIEEGTNFKDNLAVEIKEIPTQSKYGDSKMEYHTYGEYEER